MLPYTDGGALLLQKNYNTLPLILSGDFNINFANKSSEPLVRFLQETLYLHMNNNPSHATTKGGTTIDAVFSRFLDQIESKTFVSYFSYHKPIVSFLELEDEHSQGAVNTPITD